MLKVSASPGPGEAPPHPPPAPPQPSAAASAQARLLAKVDDLRVPKVGKIAKSSHTDIPLVVLGPDGRELTRITAAFAELASGGYSESTLKTYAKAILRAARPAWALGIDIENLDVTGWTPIRRWLRLNLRRTGRSDDDAARKQSPSTLLITESALIAVYDALVLHGLALENPIRVARAIPDTEDNDRTGSVKFDTGFKTGERKGRNKGRKIAKLQEKQIDVLSEEDRERLRCDPCPRDRALFTFMLDSGPRVSEVLSLTPNTYFPDDNYVLLVGKGMDGARRLVPISDETVEAINAYLKSLAKGPHPFVPQGDEPIFRSIKRPDLYPATYNTVYKAVRRATGDTTHPHALRHTAATELLNLVDGDAGQRLLTVQKILGHDHIETTRKYLHTDQITVITSHINARRAPRRPTPPQLKAEYGAEAMALFDRIRKEGM